MGTTNIIVREYLESLKESDELDKIFTLLLSVKGFRIVRTAKDALGQPQHGKDIIAIGKDADGIKKSFYFELKGHDDRNIDIATISKKDGIAESLAAMRFQVYNDSGIAGFNDLPVKGVLVHNGIVKPNDQGTLDGIVNSYFKPGDFERWDIHELTVQFSTYLFGEYLLTDDENIKLFKRILVLLGEAEYDLSDLNILLDRLLANEMKVSQRTFKKLFSTLSLLSYIVYHYSYEINYLEPAKTGLTMIVIKTWAWVLRYNMYKRKPVQRAFAKLLEIQYRVLDEYFTKTMTVAKFENGLFSEKGAYFENVGYSLRSMEYLSHLVYFFYLQSYHICKLKGGSREDIERLEADQKRILFEIISANIGCRRPLLDRHSRPILMVVLFVMRSSKITEEEIGELRLFIRDIFDNILFLKQKRGIFPEFNDNLTALIETMALGGKRSFDYEDSSSMLIMILFEVLAILDMAPVYADARNLLKDLVNLQTAYPTDTVDREHIELSYFEGNISEMMIVEMSHSLPEDFDEFKNYLQQRPQYPVSFSRTDTAGCHFLKLLPNIFYHNDIFPDQWRGLVKNSCLNVNHSEGSPA